MLSKKPLLQNKDPSFFPNKNARGFYLVITLDRISDLRKCLYFLLKYNSYPFYIAFADDEEDAFRKKTMIGFLSPFDTTIQLDTDTLVNGNLDFMFEVGERGFIGLKHETRFDLYNAGISVIPKDLKVPLSTEWLALYNSKLNKKKGCWDQDILNELIKKYPVFDLPLEYNCILQEITPAQEAEMWDMVKIFHFLHSNATDRNKFKSWQLYNSV